MGNWCVVVGTEIICWSDSTISQRAKFNLVAHKWSKDPKEKFPSANSGFSGCEIRNL